MAKKPKKTKAKRREGRPTAYQAAYAEQARKLCLLMSATDKDLAGFFEVTERTIGRWKLDFPEFCLAIKSGKKVADAEVAASLFHRACGYSHEAVKILQYEGTPIKVPYTEHYPPDTAAAFIWLKNRAGWRDRPEGDGDDNAPQPVKIEVQVFDARKPDAVA